MIREITTVEQLAGVIEARAGYLYNDFGGQEPKYCPIHSATCPWVRRMLSVRSDALTVPRSRARTRKMAAALSTRVEDVPAREWGFRIRSGRGTVDVLSRYRLQFDAHPATRALKAAIGDAVAGLEAGTGRMLEAVYTSPSRDLVDAENVLLYNVGTGRFSAAARNGLRFERVYAGASSGDEEGHHHLYAIVDTESVSRHWRSTSLVVEAREIKLSTLHALSKPDTVWLATRPRVPTGAAPHQGPYALEMSLKVGHTDGVRPADIVKPLIDGVVSALHAHDGRDADVVTARLASRLQRPVREITAMLDDMTRAWRGRRRLLWKRADGIQWNPGDDDCVSASLRVHRVQRTDWELAFKLYAVGAIDPPAARQRDQP